MSADRRRWTWAAAVVGASAAIAVPILGLVAARTLGDSTAGTLDGPAASVTRLATTPGALLVSVDGNDVVGLTTFALAPSGAGGTVLVVPVGSAALIDRVDRPTRLAAAYAQGGTGAQVTATEGMLGVTFSAADQVDQAGLQALLEPLAPIPVDLPDPVLRTAADGRDEEVVPAGPQQLSAEQAAAALFARKANESEILRLPDQVAVWEGIVSVADRVAAPATDGAPADVAGFLAAIGAGPRRVVTFAVTPALDVVTNPDGIDLLELDVIEVRMLMARILPSAVSPTGSGLRIRLVNHTGEPSALRDATARLEFVGANVVVIDDAAGGAATAGTSLAYDPSLTQEQVDSLTIATGPAVATPAVGRIDGVDVTVDLGQDFLTFLGQQDPSPLGDVASTTTGG